MSFMNQVSFADKFFPFVRHVSYIMEYKKVSFEVEVFRGSTAMVLKKKHGIVITPSTSILSKSVWKLFESQEEYENWMTDLEEAWFQRKISMSNPFDIKQLERSLLNVDWSYEGRLNDQMIMINHKPESYFVMLNKNKDLKSRFFPSDSEKTIYLNLLRNNDTLDFPNGTMTWANSNIMIMKTEETSEEVKNFYEVNYLKPKMRVELEDIMTLDATKTYYETDINYGLNSLNVKTWIHTRHNLFGVSILQEMGWNVPNKFDIDLVEVFNYKGIYERQTPDFFYWRDDILYIVDFAVTTGNMLDVVDNKKKKYDGLIEDLSQLLNTDVRLEVLVWNINDDGSFFLTENFEMIRESLKDNEMLKKIKEYHNKITQMDNYNLLAFNMDSFKENDEEDIMEKKSSYITLLSSLLDLYKIEDKLTYDVSDSRRNIKSKTMKTFEDFEITEDLKNSRRWDEADYTKYLTREVKSMLEDDMIPKHMKSVFTKNDEEIREKIELSKIKQEKIRKDISRKNFKIPKVFKFPYITLNKTNTDEFNTPFLFNFEQETEDGTMYIRDYFEEEDFKTSFYPDEGIGMNSDEDRELFEGLLHYMMMESGTNNPMVLDFCKELNGKPFYEEIKSTNLWMLVSFVANLAENISYMEGRRHLFDKDSGHTVMKNFGDYILLIRKGSKLTANKQIRYKLLALKENTMFSDSYTFHSWKEFNNQYMETKWLTISITDLEHFVRVREICLSMASDYFDKKVEMNKTENMMHTVLDKSFTSSMLILLEHKRGTSTTLQLNRYLLHSSTSYLTNREKLVDDINSSPIRSRLEAFVRLKQMEWYAHMLDKYDEINYNKVSKMTSTQTDYDRVFFPSFFDLTLTMEFGMMMNEMYLCNMFNKKAGFNDHRMKQIVGKMTEAEVNYQEIKNDSWSKGNIDNLREFWMSRDTPHMFDKKFVTAATKRYFSDPLSQTMMLDAMVESCTEIIDSAMMMTASLTGGSYNSKMLEFKNKVVKTKSFLSLFELLENMPTHLLISLVSEHDIIDAIFTIFPKSQIGGPREILIQSVLLRIMVKFLETVALKMSSKHEKEMITKDKKKSEIQSSQMSQMKDLMTSLKKKGVASIMSSFNSDASKWANGFVMEHFMFFVYNWETDERLKNFLCSVVSSFSNKVMLPPDDLMDKWARKPGNEKEFNPYIQAFRDMCENNKGAPVLESGMGQGMFHKLSSLFHVIMDDYIDSIIENVIYDLYSTKISQKTLISSDDKTKMFISVFHKPELADKSLKAYMLCIDMLYRLCNIHTNWKKSGLQFVITEFNSLFSIGKRMCWATIKDLYTANSVPDLTAPEEAVKFMLSSIRRCMEHGVYLDTIKTMMALARNQLIRYYRYDQKFLDTLCMQLDTTEDNLPYNLGFIPLDKVIETLTFGLEIHMYKYKNSNKLETFYKGLYSANGEYSQKTSRHYIPFDETGSGKFWLELPTRLDKRLIELKNNFYKNYSGDEHDKVVNEMNLASFQVNLSSRDYVKHNLFKKSYFIGMNRKYEFQETMVVHSLVRALQLSKGKGMIYPKTEDQVKLEDIIHDNSTKKEVREQAINDMNTYSLDINQFVDFCLERGNKPSSWILLRGFRKMCRISDEVEVELKSMVKSQRMNHPTMRELRFNMEDYKSTFQKEDMVNYMFDKKADFRNSSMKAFEKICEIHSMTMTDIWNNPFEFMRKMMSESNQCYKSFINYLGFISKMSGNITMRMLSDFPDSGNMKINLMNLYRSRSSPLHMFDYPKNVKPMKEDTDFLTKMAFRNFVPKILKDKPRITMEDRKVTQARKLCSFGLNTDVKMRKIDCTRLYYRKFKNNKRTSKYDKDITTYMWTDLSFLAVAKEYLDKAVKKIDMKIISIDRESVEDNVNFSSVVRFLADNVGRDINFTEKFVTSRNGTFMYSIMPNDLMYNMTAEYHTTKYIVSMTVFETYKSHFKKDPITLKIMEDNYSFDSESLHEVEFKLDGVYEGTLSDALENPPDLKTLDNILLANNWIKKDLFTRFDEITEEDMRLADISFINKQFSAHGVQDLLPKLMSLEFKEESEDEDRDQNLLGNNFNVLDTFDKLHMALQISMESQEEERMFGVEEASETVSIMMIVEKIVKNAVDSYLEMDTKTARNYFKPSREKNVVHKFHNMMLWSIMDTIPDLSDTMALMIYNIKLKEISMSTFINDVSKLEILTPSMDTMNRMRRNPLFRVINQEMREELLENLYDF